MQLYTHGVNTMGNLRTALSSVSSVLSTFFILMLARRSMLFWWLICSMFTNCSIIMHFFHNFVYTCRDNFPKTNDVTQRHKHTLATCDCTTTIFGLTVVAATQATQKVQHFGVKWWMWSLREFPLCRHIGVDCHVHACINAHRSYKVQTRPLNGVLYLPL